MKILALDPASQTGWAVNGLAKSYGTWDLKTRKDESIGMKLIRFESKLKEVVEQMDIQLIVYERPAGRNTYSIIHQSKLIAIAEKYCENNNIQYRAYSASEIKKHATGKGNCGKPAMIQAAREKLAYAGDNDNEADALWLLDLAMRELNIV